MLSGFMLDMAASGAMTGLATNAEFCKLKGVRVKTRSVTAIAFI